MKHRNEFDIHSTSKNQQKLKTVVIDLRYKWVLKTQCRIFEFFLCVKSKLDGSCDEIVYFHHQKVIYFRTSKHNYCFQN